MSDLCVFTSGTDTSLLQESCQTVSITLHTYPVGTTGTYVTTKLRKAIEFLNTRPETWMMWVDGDDSLALKPEQDILSRLHALGDPVLIAAEKACFPDAEREADYHKKSKFMYHISSQPPHINAGGWIGHREQLLTTLHTVVSCAKDENDQRAWTTAYLADMLPYVQIDHARRIFSCVADGEEALKADTCVLHFNGRVPGREEYFRSCQTNQW